MLKADMPLFKALLQTEHEQSIKFTMTGPSSN